MYSREMYMSYGSFQSTKLLADIHFSDQLSLLPLTGWEMNTENTISV